ncbi:MAG: ATP phosphoribosyltransferase regulatory subunit [Deltaproteobacteria bacterium]|nr:ATP phosphoribosyltransferase regulatory subunit [Deltaproteobacteria bacterium]
MGTQPPAGTRDFLPSEAAIITETGKVLLSEFSKWGYKRIITPSIEYIDTLRINSDVNNLFKVVDVGSGELLSFRSDFTLQIGRLSSTIINSNALPFKFSYCGPVLRNIDVVSGKHREIWQAGVEMIGPDSPESDAELIVMAIESLKKLKIKDFNVDIGNVEFFRGIISDLDENISKKIEYCVTRKDVSSLINILENVNLSDRKKDIIKELPFMFGEEDIIKKAWDMVDNNRSKRAIENIERIISYIKTYQLDDYITIDLGEVRRLHYYTGTIFECYAPGSGYELIGGGRYNNLLESFGQNYAGAGFAINLDIISEFVGRNKITVKSDDFLIANKTADRIISVELNKFLKNAGFKSEINFMDYGYLEHIEYMKQNYINNLVYIYNDKNNAEKEKLIISYQNIKDENKSNFYSLKEFKEYIININILIRNNKFFFFGIIFVVIYIN